MQKTSFRFLLLAAFVISLASCSEKKSTDPVVCYKLWANEKPGPESKPLHASYWQSANMTREYILYLELAASPYWKASFIHQNHLVASIKKLEKTDGEPLWFHPVRNYKMWENPKNPGSEYFEDTQTGHFFIYEIQL